MLSSRLSLIYLELTLADKVPESAIHRITSVPILLP
jgi:hypothetical protein